MHYTVTAGRDSAPHWTVYRVAENGEREFIERHYGDDCDANERRYARERAQVLARTLARKDNVKIKLEK